VTNGHIFETPTRADLHWRQRDLMLLGDGRGQFREARCGTALDDLQVGRGLAAGDYDDDGDIDLFVPNALNVADQLDRNLGNGQFEEIAAAAGSVHVIEGSALAEGLGDLRLLNVVMLGALDGLGLAFSARWPEAIHLGNGTMVAFIDEKANEQQREALVKIASGQAGGMPFEVIATTLSKVDVQFVPIEFNIDGEHSSAKIGGAATMAFEPVKNPVTGESESIRIEHGTGFLFKGADVVSARDCRSSLGGELDFSWPNKAGFVTQVKYGN
jgi:hypothetical protein